MSEGIKILPAVALRGTVIFPGSIVHFDVSREKSVKAVEAAMLKDELVFLVTQRDQEVEEPEEKDLFQTGTVARIKQVVKAPNNLLRVLVEGLYKAEVLELQQEIPYLAAKIGVLDQDVLTATYPDVLEAMRRELAKLYEAYCKDSGRVSKDVYSKVLQKTDLEGMIEGISSNFPLTFENRQKILEAITLEEQFEVLAKLLQEEINIISIGKELRSEVQKRINKNQREFVMREQMKVIKDELGENKEEEKLSGYREQLKQLDAPENVKKHLEKEINNLDLMGNHQAEASVLRNYIETCLSLPWNKKSEDSKDLKKAWKILEEGHYGLKDVKERIMEFLAVRVLTEKGRSPILCLVGPPGTGKTSIAKSMAEALDKKYVRMSLGGIQDEAEIRGHRRTYVAAMPGRITSAIRQAGVSNPLFLLDEIDKTSHNFRGDTASALLEVLDPEQNHAFVDHYIEVPQDLSEVLFVATANDMNGIPRPLMDRMEIIEIPGYTENEKIHIAQEHLIAKQMAQNGIGEGKLVIEKAAISRIINHYTKESGVRNLERKLGRICRRTARAILEEGQEKVTVTEENLSEFLGKERYNYLMANQKDEVGIVRGLAWTQVGGDTLQVEVNVMPGKGEIMLTGQLGDVMKESARAGLTYIRSISEHYGIGPQYFQEHDIHIHIPEGAVPKDGPSAGITMATAMFSAIVDEPVRSDLAMTGEITLRGRVLMIGGLREKLLAAKYARIREVLVPAENRPDIEEMDAEILEGLTITYVENMDQVLEKAIRRENV